MVEHGVTGLLCAGNDCGAFVAAVRSLAISSGIATTMSAAGPVVARQRFDFNAMADTYLDLYRSVMGSS